MAKRFSKWVLSKFEETKYLYIRSGKHRFILVWVVVVEGRVIVRSWNDKPGGWYRAFRAEPNGDVRFEELEIPVRAKMLRSEKLNDAAGAAYAEKYPTKSNAKYVRGFKAAQGDDAGTGSKIETEQGLPKIKEGCMRLARFVAAGVCLSGVLAFAQTPSPALLVVNKGANELAIVDPAAMKVVGRVPVGEGPHEVATDGKLAFVTNYGSKVPGTSISVIDLATQKEIKRVELAGLQRPHGIVVSGGKAYFTAESTTARWTNPSTTRPPDLQPPNGAVTSFDPAGREGFTWSTGAYATHMLVMSGDGHLIFASNIRSNSVSVLDREKPNGDSPSILVGKGPEGIDISPDEREVWVAHSQDGGVSIIDTGSKKVVQTLSIGTKRSNRLKFTADGGRVFVSDMDGGEVVVLDAHTRKVIKRIKTGGHPEGILMAPDGRVYVALSDEGAIVTIDRNTLEVGNKFKTGPDADGMAWVK